MSKEIVKFVRKSNELVEARYKFGIWETRIFTKMLTMIKRDDEDFKDYKIYLKDIIQDFSLEKNKEAYEFLRDGARKLMKKTFYIPYEQDGVKRLFETPVVSSLDSAVYDGNRISEEHLYLSISFHPKMKPYLLQLKSQFTMYDVRNILLLPSTYSIRIYELLKQYEKIGWRKFEVQGLKEILGIEDKYKLYGHFKKRVLQKAQKDLEKHTDIKFTFDEIKKGRAVHQLKFWIYKNDNPKLVKPKKSTKRTSKKTSSLPNYDKDVYIELWNQLKDYDVTETTLKRWLSEYSDNTDHVKSCVKYVLNKIAKGGKMKTVGGYINSLLQQETIFDPIEKEKIQATERRKETIETAQRKAILEAEVKQLAKDWNRKQLEIIDALFLANTELKKIILTKTKQNRFANYQSSKTDQENLQDPLFSAAFRNAIKKEFPENFEKLKSEYEPKIKAMKSIILSL